MEEMILKRDYPLSKWSDILYSREKTFARSETKADAKALYPDPVSGNDYQRTRIFDNGQTVIDYYKQACKPNTVVLTFDDMNVTLSETPFGWKVLMEQQVDVIAVRKREQKTFQQDLTKEVFDEAIGGLVSQYADKVAYGFSLGAYLALYLTADLGVRILSLSPRIPAHPVYGEKKYIDEDRFHHSKDMPANKQVSPVIVYDPKNKTDEKYVHHELKETFPSARFMKVPYGGHSMATHLLEMGALKTYICTFIHYNQIPAYHDEDKLKSYVYYRNLAKECQRHHKLAWAEKLADQSLHMQSDNKSAGKIKVEVLKEKGAYNRAVGHLTDIIAKQPEKLTFRIKLFDMLMEQGKKDDAKNVLDQSLQWFGRRSRLVKREKKVQTNPFA